jgi:hypothetical protein
MKSIRKKDKLIFICESKKDIKAVKIIASAMLKSGQELFFKIENIPLLMMGEYGNTIHSGQFEKRLIIYSNVFTLNGDLKYTKFPEPPKDRILKENGKGLKPPKK